MPIYEYVCSSCRHRTEILHGVNEPGPHYCPECGAEGAMRKAFAAPAIHFKGSGWAKKDRSAARTKAGAKTESSSGEAGSGDGAADQPSDKGKETKADAPSKPSTGPSEGA